MITYEPLTSTPGLAVYLEGRKVGYIRQQHNVKTEKGFESGWRYFPVSTPRKGGDFFSTIEDCQRSLEAQ
jgi:hypothetical protein